MPTIPTDVKHWFRSSHDVCVYVDSDRRVCRRGKDDQIHFDNEAGVFIETGMRHPEVVPLAAVAWDKYAEKVRELILAKSQDYGNAWVAQGYMGNLARVLSKEARLKNMLWRDDPDRYHRDEHGESVQDTLYDLGALAAFLVANLEKDNRWGDA